MRGGGGADKALAVLEAGRHWGQPLRRLEDGGGDEALYPGAVAAEGGVIRCRLEHLEHGELGLVLLLATGLHHQLVAETILHAVTQIVME